MPCDSQSTGPVNARLGVGLRRNDRTPVRHDHEQFLEVGIISGVRDEQQPRMEDLVGDSVKKRDKCADLVNPGATEGFKGSTLNDKTDGSLKISSMIC